MTGTEIVMLAVGVALGYWGGKHVLVNRSIV
jgi:hypothetical protein